MRLHRLHLRDVKGVRDRTVDFPDSGVVVIEGPNEIGKTTLLEAFDLLLDPRARATSQSRAVKALKPVGRDVGPRVEAEFTVGHHRVRFAKQWLRGASTELEVLSPGHEQHTGEAAQQRLDAILAESLDRPLWDALRFTQAGGLGQVALTDSAVLTEALDGATGVDLHSADSAPLIDRVEGEFLRYFTPTGRIGGELKAAVTAATAARDEAVLAHGALVETEELVRRHTELRQRAAELSQREALVSEQLARAQAHDAEVVTVVRAHEESTAALAQARADSVRAREDLARRERAVADLTDAQERLEAAREAVVSHRAAVEESGAAGVALDRARDAARDARASAREVADLARADVDHLAALGRAGQVQDLLKRWESLRTEETTARELLAQTPGVDRTLVRELETLDRELLRLESLLEASGGQVTLEALRPECSVRVDGEDHPVAETESLPVRGGVSIEVPGELRITVRPVAGAAQLASDVERAAGRRAELLGLAGVADLDGAREAADQHAAAAAQLRHLTERVSDTLAGRTPDELTAEVEELTQALADPAARPTDYPMPPDLATARAVSQAASSAHRAADAEAERADAAVRQQEQQQGQLALRVERAEAVIESLSQRLDQDRARLDESRQAISDEALREAVTAAGSHYARVEARAGVTRREVEEADVEGVAARLQQAQVATTELAEEIARVTREQAEVQGQVEMVSGEGRQEVYDQAVTEFVRLRGELERVHRRARAAQQLRDTLGRHREAAHRAYVRPYQDEIRRLGQIVYGSSFDVEVGEDLTIRGRTLDGTSVEFDQLSGGAKEQLGILSRLAVAGLVEADDGVPVIIDDALGYTDPERLERVSAVFAGPGERTQVVLLTCTPERYREIPGATTIALTA